MTKFKSWEEENTLDYLVGPKAVIHRVLITERQAGQRKRRRYDKGSRGPVSLLAWRWKGTTSQKMTSSLCKLEEAIDRFTPRISRKKCSHANALISTKTHFGCQPSGLQDNKFMLFKALSLWEFWAAAIRNQCIALWGAL